MIHAARTLVASAVYVPTVYPCESHWRVDDAAMTALIRAVRAR